MAYNLKTGKKEPLKKLAKLTPKQKKSPDMVPAPKFKPRDRKKGPLGANKYTAAKSKRKIA